MNLRFKTSGMALIGAAFVAFIAPPVPMSVSAWAAQNLIVPDGPRAGELFDPKFTPHLVEPMDKLGPDDPTNEIDVMKSAQTGFTLMLIAAIGHSIDRDPCNMMIVQPTDGALKDFNSLKLGVAIEQSPALKAKVKPQTSRSASGSTSDIKKYPGGALALAIASSSSDLRSKTVKKVWCDEVDEYPDDLDGQGSPEDMIAARQISFLKSGDWKRLRISTPTVKGASKIEVGYDTGDGRRWHMPCPGCGEKFVFEFGPSFRFSRAYPYRAHYAAPCCGMIIEGHQKDEVYRRGEWIATAPKPGAHPSYHFEEMSSPMVPWDEIAKKIANAGDDPVKLKTLWNLTFGRPYEIRGDAPDHARLMERREDYKQGHIPPQGLILVASADVQMRGIYVEVLAVAPDKQSWVVDAKMLAGDTADPNAGAFLDLEREVYEHEFPDAFGGKRRVDALAVDAGYRSHVVYMWTRGKLRAHAVKGVEGWAKPAIGTLSLVDIDWRGQKIKKGAQLRSVGTWPLKGDHYEYLRKEGRAAGQEKDPPGYCHFGKWQDDVYFRQITSEFLADERHMGRVRKIWKVRGKEENHFLDCRVYNLAMLELLGFSRMTPADWALLAKERGVPADLADPSLFSPPSMQIAASSIHPSEAEATRGEGAGHQAAPSLPASSLRDRFSGLARKVNG